ncbi:MAG: P-loop NTPase fold protein, partial [Bacteroidia bacterium]|nr:P-loop NTPase fold protein [Bacteroidia bacterium]
MTQITPLLRRTPAYVGDQPFAGDVIGNRIDIARQLTEHLARLTEGAVIGIDAPWGEGKTWFGRNWQAQLDAAGYSTVYLDAFENDGIDDPFLLIAAEILNLEIVGNKSQRASFVQKAAAVGRRIIPAVAKGAIKGATKAIGLTEVSQEVSEAIQDAGSAVGDAAEKYLETRINELEKTRKSAAAFKSRLEDIAKKSPNPIVFFVDELDRCSPAFAVKLIERIKHFFDVPNLVFVLLLNRRQISAALKGVYGSETDTATYMNKFVHFFLTLPKRWGAEVGHAGDPANFCMEVVRRFGLTSVSGAVNFSDGVSQMAKPLEMSLRDIERAFILFGLAGRIDNSAGLAGYLACLKIKQPELFAGVLNGQSKSHSECATLIERGFPGVHEDLPKMWWLMHKAVLGNSVPIPDQE